MLSSYYDHQDTIVALSTPGNIPSAIQVIRLSGKESINIANKLFPKKDLSKQKANTIHLGSIYDKEFLIDDVLVAVFKEPKSFTQENVVEIFCHGSPFITQKIIQLIIQEGARIAKPGEFTKRSYLNGKIDLVQAEAIADIIQTENEAAHQVIVKQMRGGFSKRIKELREQFIQIAALFNLELDFPEEDLVFADRTHIHTIVDELLQALQMLIESFSVGNAIKTGINIIIVGKPNVGKSTLLNGLLNEQKAIVSDIPGTTRDVIEDTLQLKNFKCRLIDTAGLRYTEDVLEKIGIEKTYEKLNKANIILYMSDLSIDTLVGIQKDLQIISKNKIPIIKIANKLDIAQTELVEPLKIKDFLLMTTQNPKDIKKIKDTLEATLQIYYGNYPGEVVTNLRHQEALKKSHQSLTVVKEGINDQLPQELLSIDLKIALESLNEIIGEVHHEDVLEHIFSKFCIGK